MNLQELSYFAHVQYCLEHKINAQIKIRRWYQFMKLKPTVRMYVYTGAYTLQLQYRYTINELGVFYKSDADANELIFKNIRETREYMLRLLLNCTVCYFITNELYDNIFVIE